MPGLVSSTILTLLVLPALYALFRRDPKLPAVRAARPGGPRLLNSFTRARPLPAFNRMAGSFSSDPALHFLGSRNATVRGQLIDYLRQALAQALQ